MVNSRRNKRIYLCLTLGLLPILVTIIWFSHIVREAHEYSWFVGNFSEDRDHTTVCRDAETGQLEILFVNNNDTLLFPSPLFQPCRLCQYEDSLIATGDKYHGKDILYLNIPLKGYHASLDLDDRLHRSYLSLSDCISATNYLYKIEFDLIINNSWEEWKEGLRRTPPSSLRLFLELLDLQLINMYVDNVYPYHNNISFPFATSQKLSLEKNYQYVCYHNEDYPSIYLIYETSSYLPEWKGITQYPIVLCASSVKGDLYYRDDRTNIYRIKKPFTFKHNYQVIRFSDGYLRYVDELGTMTAPNEQVLSELILNSNTIIFTNNHL